MGKQSFSKAHKAALDSFLLAVPDVKPGSMFGYPAYYVGGKLFACVYGDQVALKLPEAVAQEFTGKRRKEYQPFQPMKERKMREWITIVREDSSAYRRDKRIFLSSIAYVASIAARETPA